MNNLLIFGINDFAEILYENIKAGNAMQDYVVRGFILDDEYCDAESCYGEAIYPYSAIENLFSKEDTEILLCLGYKKMNEARKNIFGRLSEAGWRIASYYDRRSTIQAQAMGAGNIVLEETNIGIRCVVGNGNVFYPKSLLGHHSSVGDFNFFSSFSAVAGHVNIGNRCFFGIHSSTKDKISVADETLLGAACHADRDIRKRGLVFAASPCQSVNNRSEAMAKYILNHCL